jgi:predicted metalloprotease with PDZ domain
MSTRAFRAFAAASFVFLAASGIVSAQVERVSYTVEYRAEVLDRAFVSATISGKPDGPLDVQIPTWSPGAYEVKPFWKRILAVAARDAKGTALEVTHPDNLTWKIAAATDWPVFLTWERLDQPQGLAESGKPGPRKPNYVAFLPSDTFLYVVGKKTVPHDVRFKVPEDWLVQMSLPKGPEPRHFLAADYDTIVDAPVELGHLMVRRFEVGGVPSAIVVDYRDRRFPMQSLEDLLRRIIRYEVGMWGGKAPYAEYQFQIHDGPGFGLEHLSSTTIAVPRFLIRMQGPGVFDSLFAHEYFHTWKVKRLRPKQLGPFDYTQPVRTKALWFSEGVTDYYADVTCWRTGIWNDGKYLDSMRGEIERLQSTPRRHLESVEGSSWAAFDRGYGGIGTEAQVDYYNKGKLVGLCLDLLIRDRTGGAKSLDDVMRALYAKYALPKPGFDEDGLAKDFTEIAGFDLDPFFKSWVSGLDELPFTEMFATIGIRCTPGQPDRRGVLGWWKASKLAIVSGELIVQEPCEALEQLGLKPGDCVLSVNDAPLAKADRPQDLFGALVPKDAGTAVLQVRRGGEIVTVTAPFPPLRRWDLEQVRDPTPEQRKRFQEYKADRYSGLVENGPTLETIGLPK